MDIYHYIKVSIVNHKGEDIESPYYGILNENTNEIRLTADCFKELLEQVENYHSIEDYFDNEESQL